jgi:hypothetical protein
MAYTPDEVIEDHYGWKVDAETNKTLFRGLGALSAVSFGLMLLA